MEKESAVRPGRRFAGGLLFVLFSLLCALVLCLAAVMLHSFEDGGGAALRARDFEVTEDGGAARIQAGESSDIAILRSACGFALPYFPGQVMYGEAVNADCGGRNAVVVTMTYQSGAVIQAVKPRSAASLILREGLQVQMYEDLRIPFTGLSGGIGAMMCRGDGRACLYFSTEDAAYSIYAPTDGDLLYKYVSENDLKVR